MYRIIIKVTVEENYERDDEPLAENRLSVNGGSWDTLYTAAKGETLERLVKETLYEAGRTATARESKAK